jgi:hypothetical protein
MAGGVTADWRCDGATVRAMSVVGVTSLQRKAGRGWVEVDLLEPLEEGSIGSPVTAGETNRIRMPVRLRDDDMSVLGSFALNASESVDVEITTDANGQPSIYIDVLSGGPDASVLFELFGKAYTVSEEDAPMAFSPDVTPPVIGDVTDLVSEATSPDGAVVHFGLPDVTDDFDPAPVLTVSPASGSLFPLGATQVTITATDAAGNGSSRSFTVSVVDTTAPEIQVPADLLLDATSAGGAIAHFAATATDLASTPVISYSHPPGSPFPLGTTTVTVTATDAAGNSAQAAFAVTVRDAGAPALHVPTDLTLTCVEVSSDGRGCVKATDATISAWLASATAADAVDPAPSITHDAPAVFPIGVTIVTFRATDAANNESRGAARVRVVYAFGGFEAPLLKNGSASIQQGRQGRTIPVKFRLTCTNGTSVATAVASIAVYKVLDVATGTVDTTDLTSDAGSSSHEGGNRFRYDTTSQQYVYNLSTQGWAAPATYQVVVILDDGTTQSAMFSLR